MHDLGQQPHPLLDPTTLQSLATPAEQRIDAISRAGVTFSYSPQGPAGLVKGKTVYIITTRGGIHQDKPSDQLVPYLRTVLGFLGMTDQHVVYVEGLAYGPDAAARAMEQARTTIRELASTARTLG